MRHNYSLIFLLRKLVDPDYLMEHLLQEHIRGRATELHLPRTPIGHDTSTSDPVHVNVGRVVMTDIETPRPYLCQSLLHVLMSGIRYTLLTSLDHSSPSPLSSSMHSPIPLDLFWPLLLFIQEQWLAYLFLFCFVFVCCLSAVFFTAKK